jgi:DNA-binding FadR family transcriptional regulator
MQKERTNQDGLSEFMHYLATIDCSETERLPSLSELSQQLGISIASLREQMEVARALGLIEVRPRTGIRRLAYTFGPTVQRSLFYAVTLDRSCFKDFSDFRNHIESAYWDQAVSLLTSEDHAILTGLIEQARHKLDRTPPQIPHEEHRNLHLTIFSRLNNPFVTGVLETYWNTYEEVGLDVYTDMQYLKRVWQYHESMVNAIINGEKQKGYQALTEHTDLLFKRSSPPARYKFE